MFESFIFFLAGNSEQINWNEYNLARVNPISAVIIKSALTGFLVNRLAIYQVCTVHSTTNMSIYCKHLHKAFDFGVDLSNSILFQSHQLKMEPNPFLSINLKFRAIVTEETVKIHISNKVSLREKIDWLYLYTPI